MKRQRTTLIEAIYCGEYRYMSDYINNVVHFTDTPKSPKEELEGDLFKVLLNAFIAKKDPNSPTNEADIAEITRIAAKLANDADMELSTLHRQRRA